MRSSLHRCLQRHGIGRLADVESDKPARKKFKSYPIGYFHIDVAEVRTEQGKLHMFVAIDRTSKFAFVELHEKATTAVSRDFLLRLIAAIPGAGGTAVPLIKEALANGEIFRAHAFEYACATNDIEHRTTKARHPWTNGQVERMNRTIKEATVKRFYYESHDQLRQHLADEDQEEAGDRSAARGNGQAHLSPVPRRRRYVWPEGRQGHCNLSQRTPHVHP